MTQALQLQSQTALEPGSFTPDQLKLITDTVAKGATPDELKLFLYRCKNLGLDPLKPGQIYFIKYGTGPGSIVTGIDGFRSKAARSGKLSGIKRGVIRDNKGKCIGAWAEVYRKDWNDCAREEVSLSEYNTGKSMWAKMPETMIKKVAEAAALRMAFPDDLGGVYSEEEMDQAKEKGSLQIVAEQPAAGEGGKADTKYLVPFGKFKNRSLEEIGPDQLKSYIRFLEDAAAKKGKPIDGQAIEFITRAEEYIGVFENRSLDQEEPEDGTDEFPF
jgi:phage recombination protein Bet